MTTKTYRLSRNDFDRTWHVLDADGQPLGRLASSVAKLLLGKHKPTYEPHLAMGDYVVVVNAGRIRVTGNKATDKIYYRHSGYPGGIRERTFEQQLARDPRRVVETAVRGMLPHNSRGRELFRHLKVYAGPDHPHVAQVMAGTGARAKKRAAREVALAQAVPAEERAAEEQAVAVEAAAQEAEAAAAGAEAEQAEEAEAEAAVAAAEPVTDEKPLSRMTRAELDAEAERLGLEIDPEWNKPDVLAAVREAREQVEAD
jgi:large subunit ribosomal protein L13